jgi:hypothetical protein
MGPIDGPTGAGTVAVPIRRFRLGQETAGLPDVDPLGGPDRRQSPDEEQSVRNWVLLPAEGYPRVPHRPEPHESTGSIRHLDLGEEGVEALVQSAQSSIGLDQVPCAKRRSGALEIRFEGCGPGPIGLPFRDAALDPDEVPFEILRRGRCRRGTMFPTGG